MRCTARSHSVRFWILLAAAPLLAWGPRAAAAGDSVKIGILTDITGIYASVSGKGTVAAARMAVEEFGGHVLGKPIEIVVADHKDDPDLAAGIARTWFDKDGVDMIADLTDTPVAIAVQKIAKDRGKIDIVTGAASPLLTGEACSPTGFHWVYNSYALGKGAGSAVEQGDKTWFFITTESAFGAPLEALTGEFIKQAGGKVLGSVEHPPGISDFTPYLREAQDSGAQVIGLADAGADAVGLIRQAAQYGIGRGGQRIAGLLMTTSDVNALGLDLAQGMVITTASYWDHDGDTRAWSKKYFAQMKEMPNMVQAGSYSAVLHYLKAVRAAGTTEGTAVAAKMRALPVDDAFYKNGVVRADGLMQHDMYLAMVKSPAESKQPWDYLSILQKIPGNAAFLPLEKSDCPLVAKQ
jgi:branched-chain amino acid transport system substrate-binding protein